MTDVQRPSLRESGGPGPSLTCLLQCPVPKVLLVCTQWYKSTQMVVDMDAYNILLTPFFVHSGAAIRHCDVERGWMEPDLYNCTSPPFVELNAAVCTVNYYSQ